MVNCSNCGFDVGDSAFCPNCGTKVETSSKSFCSNCGFDVGDSAFCPNCGTKVETSSKSFCPSCGFDVGDSAFCPKCGTKIDVENDGINNIPLKAPSNTYKNQSNLEDSSKSFSDKVLEKDNVISKKIGKRLMKSKSMDMLYDKTANLRRKTSNNENNYERAKAYSKNEPAFLEVYELVEDEYIQSILLLEREKLGNVGGGAVGGVMLMVYVPTKDMSFDESKQFYINIVNKIVDEIDQLKHQGIFDEDEYYKQKLKESSFENFSTIAGLKAFKALRK